MENKTTRSGTLNSATPHLDNDLCSKDTDVAETSLTHFDIAEFELRLRQERREALACASSPMDEPEEARLIDFSGDHYAFLTDTHRLALVNDVVLAPDRLANTGADNRKEIPYKLTSDLSVGDFVIFRRGAAGDLLRDMADVILCKANQGHLRDVSRLWKVALREWAESEAADVSGQSRLILRKFKEHGITRSLPTIRSWLERERVIGPRDPEETISVISRITGHKELSRNSSQVIAAISKVHSAHLMASEHLSRTLLERVPVHIARNGGLHSLLCGSVDVQIEGIGEAVVVRVEEISEEEILVARAQVNYLQREQKER